MHNANTGGQILRRLMSLVLVDLLLLQPFLPTLALASLQGAEVDLERDHHHRQISHPHVSDRVSPQCESSVVTTLDNVTLLAF